MAGTSLCATCIHRYVCKFTTTLSYTVDGRMVDESPNKRIIKCTHFIEGDCSNGITFAESEGE